MQVYGETSFVEVIIPFNERNQDDVASAQWRLFDELGNELSPWAAVAGVQPNDTSASIGVAGALNVLNPPRPRGVFTVEMEVTTVAGSKYLFRANYMIESYDAQSVPTHSFQTFEMALLTAYEVGGLANFSAASDADKRNALTDAAWRLGRLTFDLGGSIEFPDFPGLENNYVCNIREMSLSEFEELPMAFLATLRRAQVVQADDLLNKNPTDAKRLAGIIEHTVGESTTKFRDGKPVRRMVSNRALEILSPYVSNALRIGRA